MGISPAPDSMAGQSSTVETEPGRSAHLGETLFHGRVESCLESGAAGADVAGQEAGGQAALGHRQETAGTQPCGEGVECRLLVAEVVYGMAGPYQFGGAEAGQVVGQVGPLGGDPVAHPLGDRSVVGAPQQSGRLVDGDDLGPGEAAGEQTADDARPAADVEYSGDCSALVRFDGAQQAVQPVRRRLQRG
ncbi:hypothetical protein TPA0909_41240 [Streptomyces albus]|nr:hypothetical protein TPA0909_41240 [Streptomyces albus]